MAHVVRSRASSPVLGPFRHRPGKEPPLDISAASLSALAGLSGTDPLRIPFAAAAPGVSGAAASSPVPLDPFTGLPLVSSGVQIEVIAARALFEWNCQVIAALRGEEALALAFSATSLSSVNSIQALIQGAGFSPTRQAADSMAPYTAGFGGSYGDLLGALLDYFSPAASALRMVGYGLGLLGGVGAASSSGIGAAGPSGGALSGLLQPAISAGTAAAGGGAPGAILIALQRTESFSLRALDLYAEGYALPALRSGSTPLGGYGALALSSLELDYTSETSFLGMYFGPGGDPGGYRPLDLYA